MGVKKTCLAVLKGCTKRRTECWGTVQNTSSLTIVRQECGALVYKYWAQLLNIALFPVFPAASKKRRRISSHVSSCDVLLWRLHAPNRAT